MQSHSSLEANASSAQERKAECKTVKAPAAAQHVPVACVCLQAVSPNAQCVQAVYLKARCLTLQSRGRHPASRMTPLISNVRQPKNQCKLRSSPQSWSTSQASAKQRLGTNVSSRMRFGHPPSNQGSSTFWSAKPGLSWCPLIARFRQAQAGLSSTGSSPSSKKLFCAFKRQGQSCIEVPCLSRTVRSCARFKILGAIASAFEAHPNLCPEGQHRESAA